MAARLAIEGGGLRTSQGEYAVAGRSTTDAFEATALLGNNEYERLRMWLAGSLVGARAVSGALGIKADAMTDTSLVGRSESRLRRPLRVEAAIALLMPTVSSSFPELVKIASLSTMRTLRGPVTGFVIWLPKPSSSSSLFDLFRVTLYIARLFSYSPALSLGPMVERVLDLRNR
jgi:hypothetical protein